MHPNTERVIAAGRNVGIAVAVRTFPEGTKTAADAAAAIGVQVGQIVKSLVFTIDGEPVVALVSGANQLDERRLATEAGGAKCQRADADLVSAGIDVAERIGQRVDVDHMLGRREPQLHHRQQAVTPGEQPCYRAVLLEQRQRLFDG